MSNAIAHLAGADHPDILNSERHNSLPSRCKFPALGFEQAASSTPNRPKRPRATQPNFEAWSTPELTQFRRQFRQRLIKVGDQAVIGDLEDRRFLVLVDSNNHF